MTLEEMINWIADRDHLHEGTKIIAALKAGQAMRQAFHIEEYYDVLGNKKEELDVDMEKAEGAVEAWDAVTKDDV